MNCKFAKMYSTVLPVLFVLNGYGVGGFPLGIGTILLLLFVAFSMIDRSKPNRSRDALRPMVLLCLYVFTSMFAFLFESQIQINSVINNLLKTTVWALAITVLAPIYLDMDTFQAFFRKFCIFCTIYIFAQNIAWLIGRVFIPNLYTIGPIHPLYDQYSQDTLRDYIVSTNLVRFGSVLSEPSFYGHLMLIDLILILFNNKGRNELSTPKLAECIFVSSGIVLSTSTGAIVFLAVVWTIYFLVGKSIRSLVTLMLGVGIASYILFVSPLKNNTTINWFVYKLTNMDTLGRVGKSFSNLGFLTSRQWITGVGIGNTGVIVEGYLNSFTSIIISFGIIGFGAFLLFAISIFHRGGLITKVLIIIYILGSFQGAIAFSLYGMLYISIAIVMLDQHLLYNIDNIGGNHEQLQGEK